MPTLFIFKFILKEGSMNTDIAKKLDQVIQLLQLSLLAQRVNTLSDQRILSFNVNGNTIRMSLPDAQCDFIQRVILQTNHFFEAALLSQVAKMGLIKPDTVVCDIGANIGNHSVYFRRILGAQTVLSCEPHAHVYSTLQQNLELNGLTTGNAFNVMLGSTSGRGEVAHFESLNHGATKLKTSTDGPIEMVTLDELTASYGPVGFLKLDVEGFEASVLAGAERILSKDRPTIWVELTVQHGEENVEATRSILEAHGYTEQRKLSPTDFIYSPK
jgi:FkbM family methyltransferase